MRLNVVVAEATDYGSYTEVAFRPVEGSGDPFWNPGLGGDLRVPVTNQVLANDLVPGTAWTLELTPTTLAQTDPPAGQAGTPNETVAIDAASVDTVRKWNPGSDTSGPPDEVTIAP